MNPSLRSRTAVAGIVLALGAGLAVSPGSAPARAKKWKATVVLVREDVKGIAPGSVGTAEAECPEGYDVLGGSFIIGGRSLFAHAAGAAPIVEKSLYRATVANPRFNPFAAVRAEDASVTAAAICAESGRPVVVDGPFGKPRSPINGALAPTVVSSVSSVSGIDNGSVRKVDTPCRSSSYSVFGGGFTLGGSLWSRALSSAVLSKTNDYSATLVTPPSNPSLGVLGAQASMRVAALCSRNGRPMVLNGGVFPASAARAAATKPKRRGTVVLTRREVGGIRSGSVATALARCPAGYSVFGGSYIIGGNSVLAHASAAAVASKTNAFSVTVVNPPGNVNAGIPRTTASVTAAAQCARRATPIIIDGPFASR